MSATVAKKEVGSVITSAELLSHWQGHRSLTRKLIEAFPEKEFFKYSIGGMRSFATMVQEILAINVPGLRQIVNGNTEELNEQAGGADSKENILALWDAATNLINHYWLQIPGEKFHEHIVTFGQYEGTVWSSIFYFIDNEIHHRGQAYVYLRALVLKQFSFATL